jgi:hypothetical protein
MWTGEFPGVVECRERGWYCIFEGGSWRPCTEDTPGAEEDLNRWTRFVMSGAFAEQEKERPDGTRI